MDQTWTKNLQLLGIGAVDLVVANRRTNQDAGQLAISD
jgi:hypothetical protein